MYTTKRPASLIGLMIGTLMSSVPTFAATGAVTAFIVLKSHAEDATVVKKDTNPLAQEVKLKALIMPNAVEVASVR